MSKRTLFLVIGITAIITIGFFFAAYTISRKNVALEENQSTNPFANFFPFGKPVGENGRNASSSNPLLTNTNTPLINTQKQTSLRQISAVAIAGMYPVTRAGKTAVQFVERATGNIYETTMEDMRKDRISNALLRSVEETFAGNSGKNIVYRYITDNNPSIKTFIRETPNPDLVRIETQDATNTDQIIGSFLEENVMNVLVSNDTKKMFYLTKTSDFDTRITTGSVFDFSKDSSTKVFQSSFSEWLPVFFDGKTAILQTKASQNIPGFLYSLNTGTGNFQKIIGDINGLTALLSPDQQKILYSESTRGGIKLYLYNRKEKTTTTMTVPTLPEKCVWNIDSAFVYCAAPDYIPTAEYPDTWYQGEVSFSDTLWKIDSQTGNMTAVFLPSAFGVSGIDMTRLTISPMEDFLFFINKKDSTLWGYKLTE